MWDWLSRLFPKSPEAVLTGATYEQETADFWKLLDPYLQRPMMNDLDGYLRQFDEMPVAVQHLFAAHGVQSSVKSNGFPSLFYDPPGILAPEAIEGFKALGMPLTASVVQTYVDNFGSEYPRDSDIRGDFMDQLYELHEDEDPCEVLNDQFDELIDKENGGFDKLSNAYARNSGLI